MMNPTKLVAARMSPSMPLGLFHVYTQSAPVQLFYIAEREEGARMAVVLRANDDRLSFMAWPVTAEMGSWEGVMLGDVEPLVDVELGGFAAGSRPPLGSLWVGRESLCIGVKMERGYGTVALRIGSSDTSGPDQSAIFPRWQFVQRDHAGKPIVLFETGQAASGG